MASSATDSQGHDKEIREKLVKTGHVDVMVSVGNNFFYTKSLPCSLWFFDKGKAEKLKDKVLFIDTRNYYTVVDRTLNEWTEWQLKNLNAIVWLYRGEKDKYTALLEEYRKILGQELPYEETLLQLKNELKDLLKKEKKDIYVIHEGVLVATVKGRDLIPSQSLALSPYISDIFPCHEISRDEAIAYLSGDAVTLPDNFSKGFVLLTYLGRPLGFVKNIGRRSNNLYPAGWRIKSKAN